MGISGKINLRHLASSDPSCLHFIHGRYIKLLKRPKVARETLRARTVRYGFSGNMTISKVCLKVYSESFFN